MPTSNFLVVEFIDYTNFIFSEFQKTIAVVVLSSISFVYITSNGYSPCSIDQLNLVLVTGNYTPQPQAPFLHLSKIGPSNSISISIIYES